MTPAKCAFNIPLIDIFGAQGSRGKEKKSFHFTEFKSAITVTRNVAASPPIKGTFDISYKNKTIRGIPYSKRVILTKETLITFT